MGGGVCSRIQFASCEWSVMRDDFIVGMETLSPRLHLRSENVV